MEFFAQARKRKFKRAKLAAFGFTRRKGVAVEKDEQVRLLLEAGTPVITIVGKTWLLHVTEVLRATPDENLAMIGETIRLSEGSREDRHLRRRTFLRRLQGRAGIRPGHLASRRKSRRRCHRPLRHQRRLFARAKSRASPRMAAAQAERHASASIPITIAASASPMPSRAVRPAPPTCKAPSTATANARAIAISSASSRRSPSR